MGQLGLGDNLYRQTPTMTGTDKDWMAVACGEFHCLALKRDGSVWEWGDHSFDTDADIDNLDDDGRLIVTPDPECYRPRLVVSDAMRIRQIQRDLGAELGAVEGRVNPV